MGRGKRKIEIKRIENDTTRQVTFSKRREELLKKAHELAVLCDAKVAVIVFSNNGKLFQFASSSMEQILSQHRECNGISESPGLEHEAQEEANEVAMLKEEMENLQAKHKRLLGKDMDGLGFRELEELEQAMEESLLSVKSVKEKILMGQLAQPRVKAMLENETLHKQFEDLQGYKPLSVCPVSSFNPVTGSFSVEGGPSSPDNGCENGAENRDSMTELQLGPIPSPGHRKRKTTPPVKETTRASTSGSQLEM